MRLKHFLGLNQKDSAERMGVSQPTFSRILESAHQKNTQALLQGKEIKVHGGNFDYKLSFKGYGCLNCNHEWEDPNASKDRKVSCVKCNSNNVYYFERAFI
jgi:transcriptional regulator with XRE-family HTH domain